MNLEKNLKTCKQSDDMNGCRFFVAEEGDGIYNAFLRDDFCEDGYYYGHNGGDGYHISDFDIVFQSNRWDDILRYMDKHAK